MFDEGTMIEDRAVDTRHQHALRVRSICEPSCFDCCEGTEKISRLAEDTNQIVTYRPDNQPLCPPNSAL